jgi:hypothetical protein
VRGKFSGRREAAIGLGVYAVYLAVRHLVVNDEGRRKAARNAERIVALERRLGIHAEPELQALLLPRRRFVAVLNVAYVTLNVGLTVGWLMRLYKGLIARLYDPIAAMPSIHITYAVVTAAGIAETSRSPLARALAPVYPPAVAFIIFATANHYVLDAVAGAALGLAGLRLARVLG